jgi:hypothetical protein
MQVIPLSPVPSQRLSAVVDGKNCQITLYKKTTGMFFDLTIDNVPIVQTRSVQDRRPLVLGAYKGVGGEFVMIDTQGTDNPQPSGLGSRWQLVYGIPS